MQILVLFLLLSKIFFSQASSAYWRGDKERESLQRVYGISYPDQKQLKVPNFFKIILTAEQDSEYA